MINLLMGYCLFYLNMSFYFLFFLAGITYYHRRISNKFILKTLFVGFILSFLPFFKFPFFDFLISYLALLHLENTRKKIFTIWILFFPKSLFYTLILLILNKKNIFEKIEPFIINRKIIEVLPS